MQKAFMITEAPDAGFDGSESSKVGSVFVYRTPNLPAVEVTFEGDPALLLGWPLHVPAGGSLNDDSLRDVAGMWLLVTAEGVRPDALAGIPCVFDTDNRAAASTPAFLPQAPAEDTEMVEVLDLPSNDNWYPFGLTPFKGVTRLLPHHRLGFSDWHSRRGPVTAPAVSEAEGVRIIADNLTRNLKALTEKYKLSMGITAGNETRMLLAAMPSDADTYGFTFGDPKTLDARHGAKAAALVGVKHEVLPNAVSEDESAAWFERVGRCVAGQARKNAAAKTKLPSDRVLIKGIGGEVMRGFYRDETDLTPTGLVCGMGLPAHARLHEACSDWLKGVPTDDLYYFFDMLYLENRVGGWASPQTFAELAPIATIFPLNQHRIIDTMIGLPAEGKRQDVYPRKVIQALRPELLKLPINGGPLYALTEKILRKLKLAS